MTGQKAARQVKRGTVEKEKMKKKLLIILIVALSPMVVYSAESSTLKTPKEIIQAAKSRGATQVVAELWTSRAWEKYVYPGIASGEKQWLDVAVEDNGVIEDNGVRATHLTEYL